MKNFQSGPNQIQNEDHSGSQSGIPQKQGFLMGYAWIVLSILSIFNVTKGLFDDIHLIFKISYILIIISGIVAIYGVIIRKKWAFYFLIPNFILGLIPVLLFFQWFFNVFNSILSSFKVDNSAGLSLGAIAIPLIFLAVIYTILGLLWIIYFKKRLIGSLSKSLLIIIIVIAILLDVGFILYYQKFVYDDSELNTILNAVDGTVDNTDELISESKQINDEQKLIYLKEDCEKLTYPQFDSVALKYQILIKPIAVFCKSEDIDCDCGVDISWKKTAPVGSDCDDTKIDILSDMIEIDNVYVTHSSILCH